MIYAEFLSSKLVYLVWIKAGIASDKEYKPCKLQIEGLLIR